MKSNRELGFVKIHEISEGSGDVGGSLSANVSIGKRGEVYRAYCYIWHHEQDASREGVKGDLCARGESAEEVLAALRRVANDQFPNAWARGVRHAIMEVQESLDEDGEN